MMEAIYDTKLGPGRKTTGVRWPPSLRCLHQHQPALAPPLPPSPPSPSARSLLVENTPRSRKFAKAAPRMVREEKYGARAGDARHGEWAMNGLSYMMASDPRNCGLNSTTDDNLLARDGALAPASAHDPHTTTRPTTHRPLLLARTDRDFFELKGPIEWGRYACKGDKQVCITPDSATYWKTLSFVDTTNGIKFTIQCAATARSSASPRSSLATRRCSVVQGVEGGVRLQTADGGRFETRQSRFQKSRTGFGTNESYPTRSSAS